MARPEPICERCRRGRMLPSGRYPDNRPRYACSAQCGNEYSMGHAGHDWDPRHKNDPLEATDGDD